VIRRFKFEGNIAEELDCVPMAVRRKLDRVGLKISLKQWQQLPRIDRLAICHLPANLEEERDVLGQFIRESLGRIDGQPGILPLEAQEQAEPPPNPPEDLVQRAEALGFSLNGAAWTRLDPDERYALTKLGSGQEASHNLAAALKEMLTPAG